MTEKLEDLKLRFEEVGQLLGQPDTMKDMKRFSQLSKEYRDLEKIVLSRAVRWHIESRILLYDNKTVIFE